VEDFIGSHGGPWVEVNILLLRDRLCGRDLDALTTADMARSSPRITRFDQDGGIRCRPTGKGANPTFKPAQLGRGPPYRMTIEYSLPVLTKEEEAAALAQAEYEDDMGIERDPETYTILRAQNPEDAKREAEERWRSRPHGDDDAIGYAIWRANWTSLQIVRVDH